MTPFTNRNLIHIDQQMERSKIISSLFVVVFCIVVSFSAQAQTMKPQWIHRLPSASPNNNSYTFIRIEADANNLDMGRSKCFQLLALDQSLLNTLTISYNSKDFISSTTNINDGNFTENLEQKTFEVITTEGKPIKVKAHVVDEYFLPQQQSMTTLYQVALTPNAIFDKYRLTDSYASDPATWGLSLIPGAAQMHKGSYLKGGIIIGGTAAIAAGTIICESLRNKNIVKINQSHSADVRKYYNDKANNCVTARNVCLGTLAALYIYNIVDAFVAPGARRIIVHPTATMDGQLGVGASYNF